MKHKKSLLKIAFSLFLGTGVFQAQTLDSVIENPDVIGINKLDARATFFPYNSLELAKENNIESADNFLKLNGLWKFNYSESPESRPVDFYKESYNSSSWKNIKVPGNWEIEGFGVPIYVNATYPFKREN